VTVIPRYRHVHNQIEGWFDWEDTYCRWARDTPWNGKIVEVGAYKGKSLSFLLVELANLDRHDVHVHSVDNWAGVGVETGLDLEMAFLKNIEELPYQPTIHRADSQVAAMEFPLASVDRVWLDGDHTYDGVYSDLEVWWPRVNVGGEMGGHDLTSFPEVARALKTWCLERRLSYQSLPTCRTSGPMTSSWLVVKTRG